MGSWTEQFEKHTIHQTLESVKSLLTELSKGDYRDFEIDESIQRIDQIVSYVSMTLDKTDPALVNFGTLDNINNHLATIVNQLNSFKANKKDKSHINNANVTATNLIIPLTNIIVPKDKVDIKAMRDAVSKFQSSVSQYTSRTENQFDKLNERLEELNKTIVSTNSTVEGQKSRLDESISEFQKQFSKTEEERRKKFTEYEVNWNKEYTEYLSSKKEEFNNVYQNVLKELDKQTKHVGKLVGAISLKGYSAGFKQVANEERKAKRIFQVCAVLSLVGLIWAAYLVFTATVKLDISDIRWYVLTGKIFLTTAVGILAAYLARQAEKHEEAERKNRKMELELASIETYLVGLPDQSQLRIKELLSDRFFGTREPVNMKKRGKVSGNATDVLRFLEELIIIAKKTPIE